MRNFQSLRPCELVEIFGLVLNMETREVHWFDATCGEIIYADRETVYVQCPNGETDEKFICHPRQCRVLGGTC